MTVTVLSSRREVAPHGAAGGTSGTTRENSIERAGGAIEVLRGNDGAELACGDVFVLKTPEGGGNGSAAD